jgi:hypothetical protein
MVGRAPQRYAPQESHKRCQSESEIDRINEPEANYRTPKSSKTPSSISLLKEVIQPQVLLRLPCYDFTPIMDHTFSRSPPKVRPRISSTIHFRDVTGGVYKARERIHGVILIRHY